MFLRNRSEASRKTGGMQHNKGDFFKNDNKRPTATGRTRTRRTTRTTTSCRARRGLVRAEESVGGVAGRRRTAARARVSGCLPTDPVTSPDRRVALRPLQGLVSPGGQLLLVRPLLRFCVQRPGRFHRGEEPPRCRPRAGTAQAFQINPPLGGVGRGIWLGHRRSVVSQASAAMDQ